MHVRMRATMPEQWANLREISAQQCSAFVRQFSLTNPKRREAKESLQQRKWDRGRGKPQSRGCGTPEVAKAPYTRTTRRWHPPPPAWGPPSQLLRPQQPADFSIFQGSLHSAHVIKTSKDTCTLIEPLYHTLPERVEHLHVASHAFAYCSLIQSNAQRCGSTRLFVHSSPGQQAQVATRAVLIHVLWLQEVHELVKVSINMQCCSTSERTLSLTSKSCSAAWPLQHIAHGIVIELPLQPPARAVFSCCTITSTAGLDTCSIFERLPRVELPDIPEKPKRTTAA